mgnify:CR=1 FL=1|tara:strand:+ start:231 stop:455 length:225 start_codon:yes stop_codon:yes gene_type:complete
MAISSTTFEQRIQRIADGQAIDRAATASKKPAKASRKPKLTFPFLLGLGILMGGAAYAFAATGTEYQWIISLAG